MKIFSISKKTSFFFRVSPLKFDVYYTHTLTLTHSHTHNTQTYTHSYKSKYNDRLNKIYFEYFQNSLVKTFKDKNKKFNIFNLFESS